MYMLIPRFSFQVAVVLMFVAFCYSSWAAVALLFANLPFRIVKKSTLNKMNQDNIVMIFGPCLLSNVSDFQQCVLPFPDGCVFVC